MQPKSLGKCGLVGGDIGLHDVSFSGTSLDLQEPFQGEVMDQRRGGARKRSPPLQAVTRHLFVRSRTFSRRNVSP